MLPENLIEEIRKERQHSIDKHGKNSMEYLPASNPGWLAILMEEVGEAAKELTYDHETGDTTKLRDELIDTIAVATAWVEALDRA